MKHRSVISFVIVAAALFALPQLSHDLQELKGAAGAHLHRELLHAFLNLPAGDPTAAAAPVARPVGTLFASCTQGRSGSEGAKGRRGATTRRAEGRAAEKSVDQSAMIGDPAHDPINQKAVAELKGVAGQAFTMLSDLKVEAEVAMIVPPENGIDPRPLATTLTSLGGADKLLAEAEGLRVAYAAAARRDAKGPEWQKAAAGALRRLDRSLPASYEFRVVSTGGRGRVLKFKCNECPATAPRVPPAPLQAPSAAPLPAPFTPAEWAGE